MVLETATATQMKNNFGYYLNIVMNGDEVVITKNGREVGRLVPKSVTSAYLTDSLIGLLKDVKIEGDGREKYLKEKYEIVD